jgi:geranylgeranyl diphosphate synthase type II
MDDANLRRGQPVVHVKYGTNTAILSGDVMLVYAYQYLTKSGSAHLNQLIDVFNQTAIGVCEGQQMDMNFESQDQVSIGEYIKMIELKTSVLLEAAMKMGAILANTDAQNVYHLGEFGKSMGLAFQMYDDYLDSFGDPELFGKKVGGDIIQNKKTFLYLKSLELAPTEIKNELLNLYANHSVDNLDNKVARVKQIFLSLQADQYLMQEIKKWEANCISHLEALNVSEGAKQFLKEFLIQIMQRKF